MSESAKVIKVEFPAGQAMEKGKQFFLISFVSFMIGLLSYLSYDWFIYSRNHVETNNAYIEADVFQIQSRMMGYVKEVKTEEENQVGLNQKLLELDTNEIVVEKAVKDSRLKKAKADLQRGQNLLKSQLISQSDFEMIEAGFAMAKADYQASMLKEKYTNIVSPVDGSVAKIFVRPGQFIQPGQNLMTVVSKKRFWIKANYKETQLEKISRGQNVKIELDAFPGMVFQGKVEGVYPSSGSVTSLLPAENATGNFTKIVQRVPVKISIENSHQVTLRPGMSAVTTIEIGKK